MNMYKLICFLGILKLLFKSKDYKMQNRSFNEHYYKIKSVTFSVLIQVGRKHVFGIYSNIGHKPGCSANGDGFRLDGIVLLM